jgi:hypothetical protein
LRTGSAERRPGPSWRRPVSLGIPSYEPP